MVSEFKVGDRAVLSMSLEGLSQPIVGVVLDLMRVTTARVQTMIWTSSWCSLHPVCEVTLLPYPDDEATLSGWCACAEHPLKPGPTATLMNRRSKMARRGLAGCAPVFSNDATQNMHIHGWPSKYLKAVDRKYEALAQEEEPMPDMRPIMPGDAVELLPYPDAEADIEGWPPSDELLLGAAMAMLTGTFDLDRRMLRVSFRGCDLSWPARYVIHARPDYQVSWAANGRLGVSQ